MPLAGIDRSQSFAEQPPGTCYDASNVHSFGLDDRSRVGKRWGTIKAFQDLAGTAAARRVTGLALLSKARGAPAAAGGSLELVTDDFSTYSIAATADIGDNFNVFEWNNDVSYSTYNVYGTSIGNGVGITAATGLGSRATLPYNHTNADGRGLCCGLQIAYATDNDVTAYIEAVHTCTNPAVAAVDAPWGGIGEAWGVGPTIMGTNNTSRFLIAHLVKTGLNLFRLRISDYNGNTGVNHLVSSSVDIAFSGAGGPSVFNIRMRVVGSNVTATLTWAAQAGVAAAPAAATTISVAIPAGVSGNVRGGVMLATYTNGGGGLQTVGTRAAYRVLNKATFSRLVPAAPAVFVTAVASVPSSANNFYVPANWISIGRDNNTALGVPSTQAGFFSNAAVQTFPTIDDANNRIAGARSTAVAGINLGVFADNTTRTDRKGVDFTMIPDIGAASAPVPRGGAAFRIADDYTAMVYCELRLNNSALTVATGCSNITLLAEQQILSGVQSITANNILTGGAGSTYICRESARFRFTDATADPTTGTPSPASGNITLYINGIVIAQFTPGSWQDTAGPGGVSLTRYVKCGAAVPGYGSAATPGFGVLTDARIVDGEVASGINTAETDPKILIVTNQLLQVGDLRAGTIFNTTGSNVLAGALPIAGSLNSRWYAVDGTTAGGVIIDPITLTNTRWTATVGTAPWDDATLGPARMVTVYRLRAITARFANNSSALAAPRVGAPTDFGYGVAPLSTAAFFIGGTGDAGQPSDAITALAPYSDDYLIIGCANSIFMLEGDPGYGGAIQNITYAVGILGPRAWCFDHQGNFYFLSTSGLSVMPKGTRDPQPIKGSELAYILDRIDTGNTLVQLEFDSFKRDIVILLTPNSGATAGVHIKYSLGRNSPWQISFPLAMGPWSRCQIVGPEDEDRRFLLGGNDGYIRRPNDAATADDGTAIVSRVRLGPIYASKQRAESLCSELQFIGAQGSGPVLWYWLTGDSAEEVMRKPIAQAAASGTTLSVADYGFQTPIGLRACGGCHAIEIAQTSATDTWALESIMALLEATSRRRV